MTRPTRCIRGGGSISRRGTQDSASPARSEASATPRAEPVEIQLRGLRALLPDSPIYGADAFDPGTHLLASLVEIRASDRVLVVGGGSGLLPVVAGRLACEGGVVVFADQLAEAAQVEEALRLSRVAGAPVVRGADLSVLRGQEFDAALLGAAFEPSRETLARHLRQAALLLRPGGRLYLHGGKRDGIDGAATIMRQILGSVAVLGYRKGHRVLRAERRDEVRASWEPEPPRIVEVAVGGEILFVETRAGIFANGELDEGTRLLVESLVIHPNDAALDLGCGSGILGLYMARRAPKGGAVLADSDLGAVELATRNAARNGIHNAIAVASDAYSALSGRRFDLIATNPPFHLGRIRSNSIVERFLGEAPAHLNPGGRLYVVANSFLRYEALLPATFAPAEVVAETTRFRVLRATIAQPRERRLRSTIGLELPDIRRRSEEASRPPAR